MDQKEKIRMFLNAVETFKKNKKKRGGWRFLTSSNNEGENIMKRFIVRKSPYQLSLTDELLFTMLRNNTGVYEIDFFDPLVVVFSFELDDI
jgi:hypothetical protein